VNVWQSLSGILVVFALLALLYWAAARWGRSLGGRSQPGSRIAVLEQRPLGDRRSLILVQVGSSRLLLGSTGQSISFLAEVQAGELEACQKSDSEAGAQGEKFTFRQLLEQWVCSRR
jgi:flagellar biosynthetic protein FliO